MIIIMSSELIDFLKICPHRVRDIPVGSTLFWREERVRNLYVVDSGIVDLRRSTEDGNSLILQRAGSKSILAEASVYSRRYHCDAVVTEAARLLEFSKPKFLGWMTSDPHLVHLWGGHLAATIQGARQRAEILSHRSVSQRLNGWLAMNDANMPEKGRWKSIAIEIGVTPEALYREIAKRRRISAV